MASIPGIDGVLFDLGNTLIPFTPADSMEFVLKWFHSIPGLEDKVPFPEFLESYRDVVIKEKERMFEHEWETNIRTRSDMMETSLLEKGFDLKGISKVLGSTHTGAFTSCLRMGRNGRYVLDILSTSTGDSGEKLKIGLISNACDADALRQFLDRNDLNHYFKSIIISAEVGLAKPWKRIFQMGLDEMGLSPERSVYVGDRYKVDVLGSRNVGMKPVYIRQYHTAGEPPEGVEIDAARIDNILDLIPLLENGDLLK